MVILSHPTGNANVRAAAKGLNDAGILSGFYTAIASFKGDWLDRAGKYPALSEIRRRQFDQRLKPITQSYPWYEAARLVASKLKLQSLTLHEKGRFSVDAVYRKHDHWVASKLKSNSPAQRAAYAYEDGAQYTFERAKQLGIYCYYDLPIGYWRTARRLLQAEVEKWPEWQPTLRGFKDSDDKLRRKDEELLLADHIIVASTFTASTLADFQGKLAPVSVVPYGFPQVVKRVQYGANGPLKVLFVGGLSQRKGLANLFAAVKILGSNVELTIVGRNTSDSCPALDEALLGHKWIPSLSHADVLKLMQTQDVLVFPSLFEGFGLVITEAMSQGLPVITTDRTAGPDLIKHTENGWLIDAGSTSAIVEALEDLCANRNKIKDAGQAAQETAARRPWQIYSDELAQVVLRNIE